ncbi:MAG: tetratricopeptide repeat protein, partial [Burkholderiales bacterium]
MHDAHGLPLSTRSVDSRDAYVEALELLLSLRTGVEAALDRALRADPGFALAHAARGRWLQLRGDGAAAREAFARAVELATGADERERSHVAVLARIAG